MCYIATDKTLDTSRNILEIGSALRNVKAIFSGISSSHSQLTYHFLSCEINEARENDEVTGKEIKYA